MSKIDKINPLTTLLRNEFAEDALKQRLDKAILPLKTYSRWVCYSDYCFGDPHKPNNSISFVLMPFKSEADYQYAQDYIKTNQPKDLKAVKRVNSKFLSFIKQQDIIVFAFILDDFVKWLGDDTESIKEGIKANLELYQKQFDTWSKAATSSEMQKFYQSISSQIAGIRSARIRKTELNTYTELLLVAVIGAVVMHQVASRLDRVDILGWFSDRDDIVNKAQGLVCNIFHSTLFCLLQQDFTFATYREDSTVKPFFDHFNRISDIITGTLADFDVTKNTVSKPKFGKVFQKYFADNPSLFVHRLKFGEHIQFSDILISLNKPE